MSEMKTTPGPWEVRGQKVYSVPADRDIAFCATGTTASKNGSYRVDLSEAEANARFMGSALVMLSALKAMDAALTGLWGGPTGSGSDAEHFVDPDLLEAWIQIRSAISQAEPQDHTPSRS